MTIPIANTILGLILMHGLSMTMWRALLNSTIPSLNVRSSSSAGMILPRFNLQLTNTLPPVELSTTPVPATMSTSTTTTQSPSQLVSSLMASSPFMQPVIHVHPYPAPQLVQTPQMVLMSANPLDHRQLKLDQLASVYQTSQNRPIIVQPQTVLRLRPTLAAQASTLNPIRIRPDPKTPTRVSQPSGLLPSLGDRKQSTTTEKKHVSVNLTKSEELHIKQASKLDQIERESEEIVDMMLNSKDRKLRKQFEAICHFLLVNNQTFDLKASQIDPFMCTRIHVGPIEIGEQDLITFKTPESDIQSIRQLVGLKSLNPSLKIVLSLKAKWPNIGSYNNSSQSIEKSQKFSRSLVDIINLHQLDGVDLFLSHHGHAEKQLQISQLLRVLLKESVKMDKDISEISVTFAGQSDVLSKIYNISEINRYVKYVSIFLNDEYSSLNTSNTQHFGLLYANSTPEKEGQTNNLDYLVKSWKEKGISTSKIVLGIPIVARSYHLAFPFAQGIGAPSHGPGLREGLMNYSSVCEFMKNENYEEYNSNGQAPFVYSNYDWIAYEDEKSLSIKAKYVAKFKLAGMATFALNYDDWSGNCRNDFKKFPLQQTISKTLKMATLSLNQL